MIKYICDLCGKKIERSVGPLRWQPDTMVCHNTVSLYDSERKDMIFKLQLHKECRERLTKVIQSTLAALKEPGTIGG